MAVYDRWHRDPRAGDAPCGCGTRRNPLYPSASHQSGRRWQVRWDDPNSAARRQPRRNFALKIGANPDLHADAFDAKIARELDTRTYVDPSAGEITLRAYAETWRATRTHGESAAAGMESRLRCHVYEDPARPGGGRTPKGGVSIGQHAMGLLASRPSLIAAWTAAMPLSDGSRGLVIGDVSSVFRAAMEDGVVRLNPTESSAVDRPRRSAAKAQPYAPAEIAGIAAQMPGCMAIVPYLGAGTGMREMEMAGLGADDIIRGDRPKIRVTRQLKVIGGEPRLGPIKNRKAHDVPVPPELLEMIDAHLGRFPPLTVTLPWHEPRSKLHGTKVTVRLVVSRHGAAASRNVMDAAWRTAVSRHLPRTFGRKRAAARGYGIHRLRHSFASAQLRAGTDIVRVAAWMGDTVGVVQQTYAHLMPDDHDGEAAGRAASAAFLASCARSVPSESEDGRPSQLRAV